MNPLATHALITEGFDLVTKRLDSVSERSDKTLDKLIEIVRDVAAVSSQQQATLVQVKITNGQVTRHEEKIQKISVRMDEFEKAQISDKARRALWYAQGKAVWGALAIALGAAGAALAKHFLG